MFGANKIFGKKQFKAAPAESLHVTSIFYTLQGEGPYSGRPAMFIRLAYCNLTCSFCDTFFDKGDWFTYDELLEKSQSILSEFNCTHHTTMELKDLVLVMTGGEPLLQENITGFLERANKVFKHTQIESNGTQSTPIPDETTLVISPKCLEKDGVPVRYLKPRPDMLARADCLKFVMSSDLKSPYSKVPDFACIWKHKTGKSIYCSPMNIYNDLPQKAKEMRSVENALRPMPISLEERSTVDEVISFWEEGLLNMEENQKNHEYTAHYCMMNNYTLNLQVHLYASLA